MSQADRFRISTSLLHDSPQAWSNLGLWQQADQDYESAARALANRHWQLASPIRGARLLDAGCGHGASLRHWQGLDPTLTLTALECQPACLQQLSQEGWSPVQGRFDELPLPSAIAVASQDTLMCVDAAYHAKSLLHFTTFAAKVLRPGGVLVFSTLLVPSEVNTHTRWLLRSAGIPFASQVCASKARQALTDAGFKVVDMTDLEAEGNGVLNGFAHYAKRRERELTLRQRLSTDWLKISMTGRLCGMLSKQSQVRYVIIRAER